MLLSVIGRAKSGKSDVAKAIAEHAKQAGYYTKIYEISDLILRRCVEQDLLPNKRRENLLPAEVDKLVEVGQSKRDEDPGFWIRQIEQAYHRDKPDVAIIPNIRAHNEVEMVNRAGGHTILVRCLNPNGSDYISRDRDPNHPLETDLLGFNAGYFLTVKKGQPALLAEMAVTLFEYLKSLEESAIPERDEQLSFDLHEAWS